MGRLLGIAHFTFNEGRADDFVRLSTECVRVSRERDRGTLRYDVYVNEDRTGAVVVEEYEDEGALIEHGENLGADLTESILATSEVHGELLGNLSPRMIEQLQGGPVTPFRPVLASETESSAES